MERESETEGNRDREIGRNRKRARDREIESERYKDKNIETQRYRDRNQKFWCNFLDIKMQNLVHKSWYTGQMERQGKKGEQMLLNTHSHAHLAVYLAGGCYMALSPVLSNLSGHTRLSASHSSKGYACHIPGISSFYSVPSALIPIDYEQQWFDSLLMTT